MKSPGPRWAWLALVVSVARAATALVPAEGPTIVLPPMIVAESSTAPSWLYVAAGGTEYLSRCSAATTRDYIAAQLEIKRLLRSLVPEGYLVKMDTPVVSVLVPLEQKRAGDDAVMEDMLRIDRESVARTAARERQEPWATAGMRRVQFLPNMRLDDRDMTAVFTYIDENSFDGAQLIAADGYLEYLLRRRTPMLPPWLIEGVVAVYQHADLRQVPITLQPLQWISPEETIALQRDPEARRTLLPPEELFAPVALFKPEDCHPDRVAVWRAQIGLFFRWALDPRHEPAREALWRFVTRASEQPVTEAYFAECFGFGYSDLRDRLSDYLPLAVKEPLRLDPGKSPRSPRLEVKSATPAQIARLRGEWERLQVPFVREKYPQFAPRYLGQARLTLRRAYDRGEREPRLLAALGLCELDAGESGQPAEARGFLEEAAAAHVDRPRVHYEVARLRWTELTRAAPATRSLTTAEIQPILAPLRVALAQDPPLPEALGLLTEAWLRCPDAPPPEDLAMIAKAARLFLRVPALGFRVALLQARHGHYAEAETVLTNDLPFVTDPGYQVRFEQLRDAVKAKLVH